MTTEYEGKFVTRKVEVFKVGDFYYYLVVDRVANGSNNNSKELVWNLNGNGNIDESTFAMTQNDQIARWTYPCSVSRLWALQAIVGMTGVGTTARGEFTDETLTSSSSGGTIHGNTSGANVAACSLRRVQGNDDIKYGVHTRYQVSKDAAEATFMSVLWPYKCGQTPPDMTVAETNDQVTITIEGVGPGGENVFHNIDHSTALGFESPFDSDTIEVFGRQGYFHNADSPNMTFGYCTTSTHFRSASIDSGLYIKYADTTYIDADSFVTAAYHITGKHQYTGKVTTYTGSIIATVTFYLPDVGPNILMAAFEGNTEDSLSYSYDTATKMLTIYFDPGTTYFTIKHKNPCHGGCFFPPAVQKIDTLFEFNTGTVEYLGHDLDIEIAEGHLKISDGSKMMICPDNTLVNKDSITMSGIHDPSWGVFSYTDCAIDSSGPAAHPPVYNRLKSERSLIVIKDKAAIVLENGSYTHVGSNASIIVKSGGTLYVRNGAVLEVGSPHLPGYAEIIVEAGGYLCIEANANVKFFENAADTTDKNIFYVAMGLGGAQADVNDSGASGKFLSPTGIYGNASPVAFCDLKTLNLYESIGNNKHGWSNINYPFAHFIVKDTFCAGEEILVNARGTLNEVKFRFEVCEWDTISEMCMGPLIELPADNGGLNGWDTGRICKCYLTDKVNWVANKNYKIRLVVENDCSETDDTSRIIYLRPTPSVSLNLADSACPGIGSVLADGLGSTIGKHRWSVIRITDVQYLENDEKADYGDTAYWHDGFVSNSFDFPEYSFIGGHYYEVGLTVFDPCGEISLYDTIWIPLSAHIDPDTVTIYNDGIGIDSAILIGTISGTSNFTWSPVTGLGDPFNLTVVAKPTVTTNYNLAVSDENLCTDTAYVVVIVNRYANAGLDMTICKGDTVQIGTINPNMPPWFNYKWNTQETLADSTLAQPNVYPQVNTEYILILTDTLGNTIESDKITVFVDSIPDADFTIALDTPFRFCFENLTFPVTQSTTFLWTFGNGDSSSQALPCYTYNDYGVDTMFVVCLTATTSCGDSTWCDTIYLSSDSAFFEPTGPVVLPTSMHSAEDEKELSALVGNSPNPSNGHTTIYYLLSSTIQKGEIVISDVTGHTYARYSAPRGTGSLIVDCTAFPAGVYFYTLIVDGKNVGTKQMVIQR